MGSVTSSSKFVSVIMAAYNAEETIEAAIRSILLQTHDNFELIICDDASTDNTWCLMRSLADEDSRIRLIRQEKNRGSAVARNRCLSQAQGEYIAIIKHSPTRGGLYSLFTASPLLSREPTCNRRRIEYTYQQHDLREVTA